MAHKYATPKNGKVKAAVVGARGYTGAELCRLLLKHPKVELSACFYNDVVFALGDLLPEAEAASVPVLPTEDLKENLKNLDVVFLATPNEVSLSLAPKVLEWGCSVIDLSGAFRLQAGSETAQKENYKNWYKLDHSALNWLSQAQYGLAPFAEFSTSTQPVLISNPGCYATSVLMALVPLLKNNLIETETIVIDAKSGTSGAGRKAAENLLFTEVEGECLPYRSGIHQHLPEITQKLGVFTGVETSPHFSTSLLPIRRGIISGIYAKVRGFSGSEAEAKIQQAYQQAYENYPLVRHGSGESAKGLLSLKKVTGSARTHLQYQVVGDKLYLYSLIDNLLKGASSQAVENLNKLYGMKWSESLENKEGLL